FYFQAFDVSVTLPVPGYNYNSVWTPLLAGRSPAGMAASLASLARPCSRPARRKVLRGIKKQKEHCPMSHKSAPATGSTSSIDLGKNSFHLVGLDQRGAIVWQLKCSRAQLERRHANIPSCLIVMEACAGVHYIAR